MKLRELLRGLEIKNEREVEIKGIALDSRKVREGYLFIARKGEKHDGHNYIEEAIKRGAKALIVEKEGNYPVPYSVVDNALKWASILSRRFYGDPGMKMNIHGITGTNGKTTTAFLIREGLIEAGFKTGLIGTIYAGLEKLQKSQLTTPEAPEIYKILSNFADVGAQHTIIEVSSHAIKQGRTDGITFKTSIITNISRDHLDYHKTFEDYVNTKRSFIATNGELAIVNSDDPNLKNLKGKKRTLYYSLESEADLKGVILEEKPDGTRLRLYGILDEEIWVGMPGKFNVYNALASILFFAGWGIQSEPIIEVLKRGLKIPGRMEEIKGTQPFKVFIDYAHTPDGLRNVLESVNRWKKRKIIVVFGAGGERDRGKRPQMGRVASSLADVIILTSDNPRSEDPLRIIEDIKSGMDVKPIIIVEREEAIHHALKLAREGDIVIIAGKGHEEYQEVNGKRIKFSDREITKKFLKELDYEVYN